MRLRLRPTFAPLLYSCLVSCLVAAAACDSVSGADRVQLDALRGDLEAARGDLKRAEEKLVAATAELTAAREAMESRRPRLGERSLPRSDHETSEAFGEARDALRDKAATAIQCPTNNLCTIGRSFLEEVLTNPAMLSRQARVVPSLRDGVADGMKLYAIRPGSILSLFGFHNGDLLTAINGHPLSDVNAALEMYAKLRDVDELVARITRKGEPMSITIKILRDAPAAPSP